MVRPDRLDPWPDRSGQAPGLSGQARPLACQAGLTGRLAFGNPDYTAYLLSEICLNVSTEPHLQPIRGEVHTYASANFQDVARLDVAADGFWGSRFERAFFDVKVFFSIPTAPQIDDLNHLPVTAPHEASIKRAYERVRSSKLSMPPSPHSSSLPLEEATVVYKRIAAQLSAKWGHSYSSTMAWI